MHTFQQFFEIGDVFRVLKSGLSIAIYFFPNKPVKLFRNPYFRYPHSLVMEQLCDIFCLTYYFTIFYIILKSNKGFLVQNFSALKKEIINEFGNAQVSTIKY